ncbi:hypothetical protein [Natrinema pallidum]|nr:hypothetical protein [Natrinema pallidum]
MQLVGELCVYRLLIIKVIEKLVDRLSDDVGWGDCVPWLTPFVRDFF